MTVIVPVSDLAIQLHPKHVRPENVCQLMVRAALDEGSPAAFREETMKGLYRLCDLENEVVPFAFMNFSSTVDGTIRPVPTHGGVAVMDFSVVEEDGSGSYIDTEAGNNKKSDAMSMSIMRMNSGILSVS